MSIKIVHLTSVHNANDVRILHKECFSLKNNGYDVTLVACHPENESIDGIKVRGVGKPKNRLERFLLKGWSIYKVCLSENADIYHIHDPELLPFAQLLKRNGKQVIYDMHENMPKAILNKDWINILFRTAISKTYALFERLLINNLYVIFAEISYKKDYPWINQYIDILNMPKKSKINVVLDQNKTLFKIGYIGSVSEVRGSIVTLDALSILRDKGYHVGYDCIGPIEERHKDVLLSRIRNYKLKNVKLKGYSKPAVGWEIVSKCNVGLALLKPIPNYIESYPTKVFEYMAMGLPVIVSDFPLYRDIINNNKCGICVDPQNIFEIACAIIRLIENPEEARQMGRNGRKAVDEKYNWEMEEKKLIKFYDKILAKY